MSCSACGKNYHIVNKKYNVCDFCNHKRLHNGQSKSERQQESSTRYIERAKERFRAKVKEETDVAIATRNRTPIRQQTRKEAGVKSQLSILKKDIELEAVQNNAYFCSGCGTSHIGLDKSHILSVGQYKRLELVKANIQLMCRKCHVIWESGTISQQMSLHCFVDNLAFIYFTDTEPFQKFLTRIEEYLSWLVEDQDQDKIKRTEAVIEKISEAISQ